MTSYMPLSISHLVFHLLPALSVWLLLPWVWEHGFRVCSVLSPPSCASLSVAHHFPRSLNHPPLRWWLGVAGGGIWRGSLKVEDGWEKTYVSDNVSSVLLQLIVKIFHFWKNFWGINRTDFCACHPSCSFNPYKRCKHDLTVYLLWNNLHIGSCHTGTDYEFNHQRYTS